MVNVNSNVEALLLESVSKTGAAEVVVEILTNKSNALDRKGQPIEYTSQK